MPQATKVNNAHITLFVGMILRVVRTALKYRWKNLFLVAFLEAINAASKIGVVLIISLSVRSFNKEYSDNFFGYSVNGSYETILVFGFIIGLIAVTGAISGYFSIYHSRRFGRWANEDAMQKIESFLLLPPKLAAQTRIEIPSNLNILLTQLPLHTGLAHETIARLLSPVMLILFSAGALFYQDPRITGIAFVLALLVIPFILKTSLSIQKNAKVFYGEQALKMGAGVGLKTNMLISQHGIINKGLGVGKADFTTGFFDSFDKNLMANHKTGLLIALLDAILRPVLFIIIGSLVFTDQLTTEAAIVFLGSLAYLLASSRSALGFLTNLLRFQPQVQQYYELLDWLDKAKKSDLVDGNKSENRSLTKQPSIILANISTPLSTLTLGRFLQQIISTSMSAREVEQEIYFASSSFRFYPGKTIIEHLCGDDGSGNNREEALRIAEHIGALDNYRHQALGINTKMSEGCWANLNAVGRVALRAIPLAIKAGQSIVILDFDILKPLNNKLKNDLITQFKPSILILMVNQDYQLEISNIDKCVIVNPSGETFSGKQEWFDKQLLEMRSIDSKSDHLSQPDTISASTLI